jgi:hypothetical protein
MRDLLREVETRFDLVIVDAPPLLPVTDAAIIGALASGVLLCVHAGKVRRDQLQHAMASLTAVDAVVLGGALTMVPRRGPNTQGYGYGYYGTAGATPVLEEELAAAAAKRPATEGVGVLPAESAAQLQPASLGPLEATRLEPTPLEPTRLEPTRPEPATFEPASFDREPFDPEPFDPVSQDDAPPAAKGSS